MVKKKKTNHDEAAPHDYQAKEAIIGAIILDNEWLHKLDFLTADDFAGIANNVIFAAMLQLQQKGMAIDKITIENHVLESKNLDRESIPPNHIQHIVGAITTKQNIEYYAKIVQRCAFKRRVLEAGARINELAYEDDPVEVLTEKLFGLVEEIASTSKKKTHRLQILGLTKITTEPPLYRVRLPNATLNNVSIEQLIHFRKFAVLVSQNLDFIPAPIKPADWRGIINTALDNMDIDEAPEEASRAGQIKLAVIRFLSENPPAETMDDLRNGRIHERDGNLYVYSTALLRALEDKHRLRIESRELFSMIRGWGGFSRQLRFEQDDEGQTRIRCWGFPSDFANQSYITNSHVYATPEPGGETCEASVLEMDCAEDLPA